MTSEGFKEISPTLPGQPGIYQFFDEDRKILYVGKAINLKKRVSSYFQKKHTSARLNFLASKTKHIDVTVVANERDALLLENSLIKKHQPRYNIQLKDDKSYPFICIKKEPFPNIFLTRRLVKDGSQYLGPFVSVKHVRSMLEMIRQLFPIRTCKLNLSQKNIESGKFKVCLEYHIGNCLGPCVGEQSIEDYDENIRHITRILKGQSNVVRKALTDKMKTASENYQYETANEIKKRLTILEQFEQRTTIVNHTIDNVDVFAIADTENVAFVNYFKVVNGSIIQTKTIELKRSLGETKEELLIFAIAELRNQFDSTSKEIYLPFELSYPDEDIKVTVPLIGDKKKLVQLSYKNAALEKTQYLELQGKQRRRQNNNRVLEQLQQDFKLTELPMHIECFDNSNFQGTTPVASMVVFKNGKKAGKDYRHYNIKTVVGSDDFASMKEVVYRRYKRLVDEKKELPQLIIIDGGKGQLNAAVEALKELDLIGKLAIASIAKRLEEIYFPNDPIPLHINKKSESLKLIQRIRDEAHRFAITFHRQKRDKKTLIPGLTKIDGIGPKTNEELLMKFRSEKKIKQATLDELASIIGSAKAEKVFKYYNS